MHTYKVPWCSLYSVLYSMILCCLLSSLVLLHCTVLRHFQFWREMLLFCGFYVPFCWKFDCCHVLYTVPLQLSKSLKVLENFSVFFSALEKGLGLWKSGKLELRVFEIILSVQCQMHQQKVDWFSAHTSNATSGVDYFAPIYTYLVIIPVTGHTASSNVAFVCFPSLEITI